MLYNIENLDSQDIYKLTSNLIIPRPIAWVSTQSKEGILNIAPFSYFIPLSSSPATLLISIGHKQDGSPKDTLRNLRTTRRCSIIIAQTNDLAALNNTAAPLKFNTSEYSSFHIETKEIDTNYPAVPKSAKVIFFCKYLQEVSLPNSKTIPVIVEIEKIYLDDTLLADKEKKRVIDNIPVIARVGAKYYSLGKELEV